MQRNHELFSALLDGETTPDEIDTLIEVLEQENGSTETIARWGVIGASMRGQCAAPSSIIEGVREAVAFDTSPERVADLGAARRRRAMPGRWKLPATGLAAAASVALAVMLFPAAVEQRAPIQPANDATGGAAIAQAAPAQVDATRSASNAESDSSPTRISAASRASRAREEVLNTYFIEYASHRSAQGIGGPLGYARYAAHNADIPSAQPR